MEKTMNRTLLLVTLALAVACNGDKATDTSDDVTGNSCSITVSSASPSDGTADVDPGTAVSFTLSGSDADANITLVDAAGSAVDGSVSVSGPTVTFTPAGPLAAATAHTATVSFCKDTDEPGTGTTSFTTVAGDPTGDLTGNTYNVNISGANWASPAGVGSLIAGAITADLLVGVISQSDTELGLIGGVTTDIGGPQDYCAPSIDFPVADFSSNPSFVAGPSDVVFQVSGYTVPITSLLVSGTFATDGSVFTNGQVAGQIDVRDIADLLGSIAGTDDPVAICGLLAGFGATCVTCATDSEPLCIDVLVTDITASLVSGTTVECVDESNCHPMCEANTCGDPTAGECP
jgi:hypothetical protein